MKKDVFFGSFSNSFEVIFSVPNLTDLRTIELILRQWVEEMEVQKYLSRIKAACEGYSEFGMCFFVMKRQDEVIGVGGLSDPLPSIKPFAKTSVPGELKILYLDSSYRGQGFGTRFLVFLEAKAVERGYKELLIRSAEQFRETAFSFYRHCGYEDLGQITNSASKPMELFRKALEN